MNCDVETRNPSDPLLMFAYVVFLYFENPTKQLRNIEHTTHNNNVESWMGFGESHERTFAILRTMFPQSSYTYEEYVKGFNDLRCPYEFCLDENGFVQGLSLPGCCDEVNDNELSLCYTCLNIIHTNHCIGTMCFRCSRRESRLLKPIVKDKNPRLEVLLLTFFIGNFVSQSDAEKIIHVRKQNISKVYNTRVHSKEDVYEILKAAQHEKLPLAIELFLGDPNDLLQMNDEKRGSIMHSIIAELGENCFYIWFSCNTIGLCVFGEIINYPKIIAAFPEHGPVEMDQTLSSNEWLSNINLGLIHWNEDLATFVLDCCVSQQFCFMKNGHKISIGRDFVAAVPCTKKEYLVDYFTVCPERMANSHIETRILLYELVALRDHNWSHFTLWNKLRIKSVRTEFCAIFSTTRFFQVDTNASDTTRRAVILRRLNNLKRNLYEN